MTILLTRDQLEVATDCSEPTVPDLARCPECGEPAVLAGPREYDTGHQPVECSARCGWTN